MKLLLFGLLLVVTTLLFSCHRRTYYDCRCHIRGADSTFFLGTQQNNEGLTKTICDSVQIAHPADSCYVIKQSRGTPM
jgi:hypothetical protein